MANSFRRSHARTATLSSPDPVVGYCQSTPPPETPGPSQASLGQSLVGSLLLFSGSWCTQGCLCPPSLSPQYKFCNQIHWPPKSNSLGAFLVPLPDPQDGKSVVGPRTFLTVWEFIWYNCSAVCGSSAQRLFGGANSTFLQEGLMSHAAWPRSVAARAPVPAAGHCWPVPPQETLKHS